MDAKRNVKQARLPVGTMVMLEDPLRSAKSEPRWVGPYRVVKVTKAGTYSLLDSTSALFGRNVPRQQLKVISFPVDRSPLSSSQLSPAFVVEKVIAHRGPEGARQYLVKWKDFPSSENTWEPQGNFEDVAVLTSYWASQQ